MAKTKVLICPYCGETQPASDVCRSCQGTLDAMSRQASHNAMGPWTVRDEGRPFFPGCSYETLVRLIERGQVTKYSILRGPTTKQFWTIARHVPGIAHLVGFCHACDAKVNPTDHGCPVCGVPFGAYLDRNYLGLPEVRPLPGEVPHHDGDENRAWNAPAMTPRGISSFAEDSEVLAVNGMRPGAESSPPPPPAPADSPESRTSSPAPDRSWRDAPAVRSMKHRMARQQRTIRGLIALVIVIALGGAILNLLSLRRAQRNTAPQEIAGAGSDAADAVIETPVEEIELDEADPTSAVLDDVAALPDEIESPAPEITDPVPPPPPPPAWHASPGYEEAMTLVASARDRTRALDDRVADMEAAIESLVALRPEIESEIDREALQSLIDGHELELERLRLEKFFPG